MTRQFFVAGFAEVEVDTETGQYHLVDYTAIADVGTVIHPRALGGQVLGRSVLGMGHALAQKTVYDQHYGVPLAKRFYQNRPPTILDVPRKMTWEALEIPDPETPVGARGIGDRRWGAALGACARSSMRCRMTIGDEVYRRSPVGLERDSMALEHGPPHLESVGTKSDGRGGLKRAECRGCRVSAVLAPRRDGCRETALPVAEAARAAPTPSTRESRRGRPLGQWSGRGSRQTALHCADRLAAATVGDDQRPAVAGGLVPASRCTRHQRTFASDLVDARASPKT